MFDLFLNSQSCCFLSVLFTEFGSLRRFYTQPCFVLRLLSLLPALHLSARACLAKALGWNLQNPNWMKLSWPAGRIIYRNVEFTWTSPWCPWWDRRSSRPGWKRRTTAGRGCGSICRWCWCRSERYWPALRSPAAGRPGRWPAGWERFWRGGQRAAPSSSSSSARCWRPPWRETKREEMQKRCEEKIHMKGILHHVIWGD